MIYGATGYTGRLVALEARRRGFAPILAGRDEARVREIAAIEGLRYRVFDLQDPERIDRSMKDIDVVLNCAGPFSRTAVPILESCLRSGTHYLDLAGEIDDFERIAGYDQEAQATNIMLMPGVGFDVVPSDCLALYVSKKVQRPRSLLIAISALGGMSRGTMKTAVEGIGKGIRIRKYGRIVKSNRIRVIKVNFTSGRKRCISMTWGDVFTAFYTTGIENIEAFFKFNFRNGMSAFILRYFGRFYGSPFMQRMFIKKIEKQPEGPSEEIRNRDKSEMVAIVEGDNGVSASARLVTPEGYKLTVLTSLLIAEKVLNGHIKKGFSTPAMAFGPDLIMEIDGIIREDL